jgi:hypothetical protein
MKKSFFIILSFCALALLNSCSRIVTVYFERETPDIVPTDENFYGNVKTFKVISGNQNIIYSADELSSSINILINSIEKQFIKQGFSPKENGADIVIEVIGIEKRPYATNTAKKKNGKNKVFSACNFQYNGNSAFIKVKRGEKSVNYTFYGTPCVSGCTFKIGKDLKTTTPISSKAQDVAVAYSINAKSNPLTVEELGNQIALLMIGRIKDSQ